MGRTRSYKEYLDKLLQDPHEAAGYLNAAMEDEDPRVFLIALRDVTDAYGGMSWLAEETDLNRESLYRTLSKKGNPRFTNLRSVLGACGLHLSIGSDKPEPARKKSKRTRRSARP